MIFNLLYLQRLHALGAVALVLTLILTTSAGLLATMQYVSVGMNTHHSSDMAAACPMTTSEHIDWWSVLCAATASPQQAFAIIVFFSALILLVHDLVRLFSFTQAKDRFRVPWMGPLQELFSNGLLHPRVYA